MFDIAIVGSGVIGAMLARSLARYEGRFLLLEKENDVSCGASRANSGIVHGGYDATHGSVKSRFVRAGNQSFDRLQAELNFGFKRIGSLVVGFSEKERQHLQSLLKNGVANGVHDLQLLDATTLHKHQAGLNPQACCALYCPSAGIASPYELTIALAENAVDNGVQLELNSEVIKLHREQDHWLLMTKSGEFRSRLVVNCAGLYSDWLAQLAGDEIVTVEPWRGDYLLFDRSYQHHLEHVLFLCPHHLGKGVLLTPTIYGNLMIGPHAQRQDSKAHPNPDKEGLTEIFTKARQLYPQIDAQRAIRAYAGLRARNKSRDFIVGFSKKVAHFYHLASIDSPGLTAAPALIAAVVKDFVQKNYLKSLRNDFRPYRPAIVDHSSPQLSPQELQKATALTVDDRERIVCRCEQVRLKTLHNALQRSLPVNDVAAMKRRTRAGMGRCQGAFCGSQVAQLLSQHNRTQAPLDNFQAREVLTQFKKSFKETTH